MSKRTDDLHAKVEALRAELVDLGSVEDPSDEQIERSDAALAEYEATVAEFEASRARDEKIEAVRQAAAEPRNLEPAFHAPNVIVRNKRDLFGNLDAVRTGQVDSSEVRNRAVEAIETSRIRGATDAGRESALHVLNTSGDGVARLALLTGSPAYRSAFDKILAYPQTFMGMLDAEEQDAVRTALSTTAGNGGYAIPFLLDASVINTGDGSANPFRQIGRIVRGTSNKWQGLATAGITAAALAEGVQASDQSPTFTQPAITAFKSAAFVFGSFEVFEDTDLASELPALVQTAKDDLEASQFATGNGTTAPKGIITALTAASGTVAAVTATTGGVFTSASVADVYKLPAAVPPKYRSRSSWIANYSVYNLIRQMSASAAGSSFWANLGAAVPERLLGLPVYEASAMDSTMTTGAEPLVLGDFQNFVIYDRVGMTVEYIPNMVSGAGAGYPTGQRGWFSWWRSGSDVTNANGFRYLYL